MTSSNQRKSKGKGKTLIFTDPHVDARNGSRVFRDLQRAYFKEILIPACQDPEIKQVICGGDFFDNRNHMSLATLDYMQTEFLPMIAELGKPFYIIVGNHDIAFKNTNRVNSLSMFKGVPNVVVVEDDLLRVDDDFTLCPWINPENSERITQAIVEAENGDPSDMMLLGHFEIAGMRMYKTSSLCEHGLNKDLFDGYKRVLSGHFHHPSCDGNIEYIGATFHLNWQDVDDWRGYIIYDPETDDFERVENEFCIFNALTIDDVADSNDSMFVDQYVRLYINRETSDVEIKDARHRIESAGCIKLDVVDLTIVSRETATSDSDGCGDVDDDVADTEFNVKTPQQHFDDACDDNELRVMFADILKEVEASRIEHQQ